MERNKTPTLLTIATKGWDHLQFNQTADLIIPLRGSFRDATMASRTPTPDKAGVEGSTPDADVRQKQSAKSDTPGKKGILSKLKSFWIGLALDAPTLITMAK
jgi:hypothetical protein